MKGMVDKNLTRLADRELLKLFSVTRTLSLAKRAKEVVAELERRGYIYDEERGDFVTCAQWNTRHIDALRDCEHRPTPPENS